MFVPIEYLRELLAQYSLIDEEFEEIKKDCDELYSLMIKSPETESRKYKEAYGHLLEVNKEKQMAAVSICNILMRNVLFADQAEQEGVTNWKPYEREELAGK